MKYKLACVAGIIIFNTFFAQAQAVWQKRNLRINYITRDSIILSLNEDFDLIEDTCAQITRTARFDSEQKIFCGKFRDISRSNPNLIITEGTYNKKGLKDGLFTAKFLDGKLQAKGYFKNGQYDGNWEVFYNNGTPRIKFTATDNVITISDAWDKNGKKIVDNGKGVYRVDLAGIYWRGKLLNGRPDGTWEAIRIDDITETNVFTEKFKNGEFKKGEGFSKSYDGSTRSVLIDPNMLPFTRTEFLKISTVPCNGEKPKHGVSAQYRDGMQSYADEIKKSIGPYINRFDIRDFETTFIIQGYVNENGGITDLKCNNHFREDLTRGLMLKLMQLPLLVPASIENKPARQKIEFRFTFTTGFYSFNFNLSAIEL